MTRDQTSIIWLGLVLIVLNLLVDWNTFKAVVFGSGAAASSGPTGDNSPKTSNPPLAPGPPPPVGANPTPPGTVVQPGPPPPGTQLA